MSKLSVAAMAMTLAAAAPAHADAVADFKASTTAVVRTATVDLRGYASTENRTVAKAANTLDLTFKASDIGLSVPVTVHLRGTVAGNGRITYTIDDRYSPAVDLGNGQRLSRITGHLDATARWMPAIAPRDVGDVMLRLVGSSNVIAAQTSAGTQTIPVVTLDIVGGGLQPPLDSFVDTGAVVTCSDTVPTSHTFRVTLTDVSRGTGAPVELYRPFAGGVRLPPVIYVPARQRSVNVTAVIEPNFVGTVHLVAAAGGVPRALDLAVHPHRDCH